MKREKILKSAVTQALKVLVRAVELKPRWLGALMAKEDETGHTLLCRLFGGIVHYGPQGTFASVHQTNLESGGHLCVYGCQCGAPTEDYTRQMVERLKEMRAVMRMLTASGALISQIWENPRFSSAGLCQCGNKENPRLPEHDPLCPYRIEHHHQPTFEEYRKALRVQ